MELIPTIQIELNFDSLSPINEIKLTRQNKDIYEYMKAGNRINPFIAESLFKCKHLHSRIPEIIKAIDGTGLKVCRRFIKVNDIHVKEYWIE